MQRTDRTDSPDSFLDCWAFSHPAMNSAFPFHPADLRNALAPEPRKVCMPTVPLLKRTAWVPSWRTDIRVTFAAARAESKQ